LWNVKTPNPVFKELHETRRKVLADPESKKPIYEVFRKAGTSDWRQAADPLLPITGLDSWDQVLEAIIR